MRPNTSLFGHVYDDISASLAILPGASFSHVFRASNSAAHFLAQLALHSNVQIS